MDHSDWQQFTAAARRLCLAEQVLLRARRRQSDLRHYDAPHRAAELWPARFARYLACRGLPCERLCEQFHGSVRSEEHTSELQSLMRNSYAIFCLTKTQKSIKKTDN